MKSFNVPVAAVHMPPSHHAPSVHRPGAIASPAVRELDFPAASLPTEVAGGSRVPAPPAGVSPFTWEMLFANVVDAQHHSAASLAPLRESVQSVVRELRASDHSWEHVYAVLHGAVPPAPERVLNWEMEFRMYSGRSTALVAHMQSWADVERLAEIEAEAHAG